MRTIDELMNLEGRTALITGGGGHIGFAMASALSELGATVVLADCQAGGLEENSEKIRMTTGALVARHIIDLADEAAVRALPSKVASTSGGLDILINCAAYGGTANLPGWAEPFETQSVASWRLAVEVNLTAVFVLSQAALPFLKRGGKGSIINVASIYGMVGPDFSLYTDTKMANPAAYGASKGGLIQLTRYMATAMAPDVRVNAISPGGVARNQPPPFVERYIRRTPLQRMGIEEDFKGITVFLASDLSAYVTGQNIAVDGGWCCW